jgi:hypothetical protein
MTVEEMLPYGMLRDRSAQHDTYNENVNLPCENPDWIPSTQFRFAALYYSQNKFRKEAR